MSRAAAALIDRTPAPQPCFDVAVKALGAVEMARMEINAELRARLIRVASADVGTLAERFPFGSHTRTAALDALGLLTAALCGLSDEDRAADLLQAKTLLRAIAEAART